MRLRTLGAACAACAVVASSSLALAETRTATSSSSATPTKSTIAKGDKHAKAKQKLIAKNMFLAKRLARVKKQKMSSKQRTRRRAALRQHSLAELRRSTRRVAKSVRRERSRRYHGGAPNVPIPGALRRIAMCESHGNPRAISPGGRYRGKYQFSFSTWRSVGGKGDPARASETEQDRRAAILYRTGGPGHWPVCGR